MHHIAIDKILGDFVFIGVPYNQDCHHVIELSVIRVVYDPLHVLHWVAVRRTGRPVRYLNVVTVEPIFGRSGHMDCSRTCVWCFLPLKKGRRMDSSTLWYSRLSTRHHESLGFSIPLLKELSTVINEPSPKLWRRGFLTGLSSNVGVHRRLSKLNFVYLSLPTGKI